MPKPRLACQFCRRPVDEHAARTAVGRICSRCINANREQPKRVKWKGPMPPRYTPRTVKPQWAAFGDDSLHRVKPRRVHGDVVQIPTPRGTIKIEYKAGDGGRGWSIPSTEW